MLPVVAAAEELWLVVGGSVLGELLLCALDVRVAVLSVRPVRTYHASSS